MAYRYKPIQATPILNLSSKMDDRTNFEVLNVDPNTSGFTFVNLQNADLFNTKALSARLGVEDISNGIINETVSVNCVLNLTGTPSFSGESIQTQSSNSRCDVEPTVQGHKGLIIVPSGNFNIYSGNVNVLPYYPHADDPNLGVGAGEYQFQMWLWPLNQQPAPSSGVSFFSGTSNVTLHDIAFSGNYNTPTLATSPQVPAGAIPIAISNSGVTFNTGAFSGTSNNWFADIQSVPFKFEAPVGLTTNTVYFLELRFYATNQIPTASASDFFFSTLFSSPNVDVSPNTVQAIRGVVGGFDLVTRQSFGIGTKGWVQTCLNEYQGAGYILVESPTAMSDLSAPLISGTTFSGQLSNENVQPQVIPFVTPYFTGSTATPNISTETVEFGQVFTIPSGTWDIYGGYFYATPNMRPAWSSYNRTTRQPISGNGYTLGYAMYLSEISSTSGSIAGGNFSFTDRNIIGIYSGTYTFGDNVNTYNINTIAPPNNDLNKIYGLFFNPPEISNTSGTNYMLSVKFYDPVTGGPYTDYSYRNITTGFFSPNTAFQSFIETGYDSTKLNTSGTYVTNYNGDGSTFITPSGDAFAFNRPTRDSLTSGLLYVASGNAITSLYDYRIGENRSQRVIVTVRDQIREFQLPTPNNQTVIHSGAAIGNNFKWSHTNYQNIMFSHQYSQTSGVCWDQIYVNPSGGDYTQLHGLRPQFSLSEVSGTTISGSSFLASGTTISVILGTQMASGGIRFSDPQSFTASGNNAYMQISGNNIFVPSGTNSQYKFDVLPQSTYVFVTQASGSVYYLAALLTSASGTSLSQTNPLPNSGTFPAYINNVTPTILVQQIPQVINYDQRYAVDQVDVPKFKKLLVYKDYVVGAGDPNNPSRLWYSEQFAPQIFGTDGQFTGFIDVDLNNGSPITGMEIYKDYLIVFKYNSTYRLTPTGDPSIPFQVTQISNTIGSLGFFCTVSTDYGAFCLSQFGPALATVAGIDTIGDEIVPFFSTLDHTDLTFSVAMHDRLRQQIYWSISSQNISPFNNFGLCYSYAEKAWNIRQGGMWNAGGIIGDADNFNLLYVGDNLGQIQQLSVGNTDEDILFNDGIGTVLTQNITLEGETPWMAFGNDMDLKQLRNLRVNCDSSDQMIKVDVYFDQDDSTIKYTRYLNMNVPVMNRVVSLAGTFRTVKFVLTTIGTPSPVKLNSLQIAYQPLGRRSQT